MSRRHVPPGVLAMACPFVYDDGVRCIQCDKFDGHFGGHIIDGRVIFWIPGVSNIKVKVVRQ